MVSAVAPGAVVNTDLLPRRLPFLPSERGDECLEPPPAVHGAGFSIEVARSKRFELLAPDSSVPGQTEKNSVRARVFRFALELGHSSMQSSPRTSK